MSLELQQQILQRRAAPEAARAYQTCLRYIHQKDLQIGDQLPPQSRLYRELGICQGTLSKALDWLVQDGVILRKQRAGTIVQARYPEKQVPPIWSVGLALAGIHWNPTYPRLAYELHRNLVRLHCRDRIYMISPNALPCSEVDQRELEDFTGLAEDVAEGNLDTVLTAGRLWTTDIPVCHVLGWELAKFGVLIDTQALVLEAGRELMDKGCRQLAMVTVNTNAANRDLLETFNEMLGSFGFAASRVQHFTPGEGYEAGQKLGGKLISLAPARRPDGIVILDDQVAAGLTARLAEDADYRPALAIQTNKQVPLMMALPATLYEIDLALMANRAAEKLVGWLLNPEKPQTVDRVLPTRNLTLPSFKRGNHTVWVQGEDKISESMGLACDPQPATNQKKTRGFTLIELLVVIAIISLLVTLVVPCINSAIQNARNVGCLSNLRQINIGLQMYQAEHDEFVPSSMTSGEWQMRLAEYLGVPFDGSINLLTFPRTVFACPSVRNDLEPRRSYGFNARLPEPGGGMDGTTDNKLHLVESASETVLVADALNTSWLHSAEHISFRHRSQKGNVLYCDGHITSLSYEGAMSIPRSTLFDGK